MSTLRRSMSLLQRYAKPLGNPELSFFGFNLQHSLENVRSSFPALCSKRIEVWLQMQPTLASISYEGDAACIRLHSVLNHPHTPERVIAFILGHELLHLMIPPREINGECKSHPPEFWAAERERFPDRDIAWLWMTTFLGSCLKSDKKHECTWVKANWKRLMAEERPTMERIAEIGELGRKARMGDSQLQDMDREL